MLDSVLDFVKKLYRGFVAIWLIFDVIASTIIGGVIGAYADDDYIFWGILGGFVFGVITSILTGGLLVTIISIERNTDKTVKLLRGGKNADASFDDDVSLDEDVSLDDGSEPYCAPASAPNVVPKTYGIPDGTKTIGNEAFKGRTDLTSITIPGSVTSIGKSAFSGCTGLTAVTIPDPVTSIGDMAFQDCTGITSVTIGSGVTSVGTGAFSYCRRLTSVTVLAQVPPLASAGVFQNVPGNACLYVPEAALDAYKTANTWRKFLTIEPV